MREIPAHPAQATAFFLNATAPGPAFQIAQLSLSLGEMCPAEYLRLSWQKIAASHEMLRSSFRKAPTGELMHRIHEAAEAPWRSLDWKNVPPQEIPVRWAALLEEDAAQPTDPGTPPTIRFVTIDLPGGHCHLLATFPRYLLDEDSLFLVICEWLEALEGRATTAIASIEPVPTAQGVADWWPRQYPEGIQPATLRIEPPYHSDAAVTDRAETSTLLDRETSRDIKSLCQRLNIPTRDLFLAVWGHVLSRLCSQVETTVLAPCTLPFTLPGFAENLLPLKFSLQPSATVEKWLTEFSRYEKERTQNAAISLDRVLALVQPRCALKNFTTAFQWSPPPLNDRVHDAFPRWINLDAKVMTRSLFPLSLEARDGIRFGIRLEYAPSVYAPAQAERLLAYFLKVLEAVLENPSRKVSKIRLLSDAEWETYKKPETSVSKEKLPRVEESFATIAAAQPESPAIAGAEEASLTYSEVDAHSRALAAYFRKENRVDGWNIAVCLTPTPWLPVAVLGVLKAGNTCVPLDPNSSPTWLNSRVDGCDVEMVLCDTNTAPFFEGSPRTLLILDQQWETIAAAPADATTSTPPKLAMLLNGTENDAPPSLRTLSPEVLASISQDTISLWDIRPGDRIPLLAAPGTTAFAEVLFASLLAGATLLIPTTNSPWVLEGAPTHLALTSARWRNWLARSKRENIALPESLRSVTIETISLPASLTSSWQEFSGEVATLCHAGPLNLSSVALRFTKERGGHPSPGVEVTLHDPAGHPLPAFYQGSLQVSAQVNADSRITLPAWRDPKGEFHLSNSEDEQVAEALRSLPEVLDAYSIVVNDEKRSARHAWLLLADGSETVPQSVTAAVKELLPRDLQPDFVFATNEFVLTSSGDIHHSALPKPTAPVKATPRPAPSATAAAPATAATATAVPEPVHEEPAASPPPMSRKDWEPLTLLHHTASTPSLYFVHDADGDPSRYGTLAALLEGEWTLYATAAKDFHEPGASFGSIESEAASLVQAICLLDPDGPYHLVGHGYGAILAMEMARQLRAEGRQVPYLALAGGRPPVELETGWKRSLSKLLAFAGDKQGELPPSSPVAAVRQAALKAYHPQPLDGPAGIILGADQDEKIEDGWFRIAPEAFVERMSCNARDMLSDPAVRRLAVILRECAVPPVDEEE